MSLEAMDRLSSRSPTWALVCVLGLVVAQACSSSPSNGPSTPNPGCVETNGAACATSLEGNQCTGAVCTPCGNQIWALGAIVTCTCTSGAWSCPGEDAGACNGSASALYANPACTVLVGSDAGIDATTPDAATPATTDASLD
jgi:hypothetical protein